MGSYNSQYESYYNSLVNRRKNYGGYDSYGSRKSHSSLIEGNFLVRRITIDLIGVFVLFIFVVACKLVSTPQTAAAYKYSKEIINKSYDYSAVLTSAKKLNFKEVDLLKYEDKFTNWMDTIKAKLTGGKTLKEEIMTTYLLPVDGDIVLGFEDTHEGIEIEAKEGTTVVSSNEGKVKECGENGQLGKYIIIDHGSGIETKYSNLNEISVKKDAMVGKGEVIGKSGGIGNSRAPHIYFELLYMGENRNPEEYFSFLK